MSRRPIEILLVEDDPADVRLTKEAFEEGGVESKISVVRDGAEAMAFLRGEGCYADAPKPDLILLDLNMPKKSGSDVLSEMKKDPDLRRIPVLILTTSESDIDVNNSYDLHANGYISKPVDLEQFVKVVQSIEDFWLTTARLPRSQENGE